MINYCIQRMKSPMGDIKVDLGTDLPLWMYVKKAIQDIEVINQLELYRIDDTSVTPFIHVITGNGTHIHLRRISSTSVEKLVIRF